MRIYAVAALTAVASLSGPLASGQAQVTMPSISEEACPLEVIEAPTRDGQVATAVVRKPPGQGPFPAVVFLHGGLEPRPVDTLKKELLDQPTQARFLAAGYVTVNATFRSRKEDPQTRDALTDCLAIIERVKAMPAIDPKSVVVMGGSGGGSLALELAGEAELCAVAAGEPASVLLTGMMTKGEGRSLLQRMMDDPRRFYTPDLQEFTRAKIRKVRCPVFIGHGDQHPINKINHEIIIPELKAAGKELEVIHYPGQPHGFYFGRNGDPAAGKAFFDDCHAYFKTYLPTQPAPVDETLIEHVPNRGRQERERQGDGESPPRGRRALEPKASTGPVPLTDLTLERSSKGHARGLSASAAVFLMSGPLARGQAKATRPEVSEGACPLEVIEVPTRDGQVATAVVRKPPGQGPFPAVILLHAGMGRKELERGVGGANQDALHSPQHTRFLAAGYVTVSALRRGSKRDPQSPDSMSDCLAVVEHVKKMPEADPYSVVIFGHSGGGSLALELAGETPLAAIVAGEPATVLFIGMLDRQSRDLGKMMDDPQSYYTPKLRGHTREKIAKINCPILICQGDQHPINNVNDRVFIPELRRAGKKVEVTTYPGQPHSFFFGSIATGAAGQKVFDDAHAFFKKYLPTQPAPLDESLVRQVPIGRG